jgi:hypothetical protein
VLQAEIVARVDGLNPGGCGTSFSAAPGSLWVVTNGSVARIDTTTNQQAETVALDLGSAPQVVRGVDRLWAAPGYCETGSPAQPMVVKSIDLSGQGLDERFRGEAPGFLTGSEDGAWVTTRTLPIDSGQLETRRLDGLGAFAPFTTTATPRAACGRLWVVEDSDDGQSTNLTARDVLTGRPKATVVIPESIGGEIVQLADSCWFAADSPTGEQGATATALWLLNEATGDGSRTVVVAGHVVVLGRSAWLRTLDEDADRIQRIDPNTGESIGPAWLLPVAVHGGAIIYADGAVWVFSDMLYRLDISVDR